MTHLGLDKLLHLVVLFDFLDFISLIKPRILRLEAELHDAEAAVPDGEAKQEKDPELVDIALLRSIVVSELVLPGSFTELETRELSNIDNGQHDISCQEQKYDHLVGLAKHGLLVSASDDHDQPQDVED